MKFVYLLGIVSLFLFVYSKEVNGYKIDFQRGENHIHLESTAVGKDGKVINEPRVDEAIKTLSNFKFNSKDKDIQKNQNNNKYDVSNIMNDNLENTENSRIFITNINKNINKNDENGDQPSYHMSSGGGESSPSGAHPKQLGTAHHHEKQVGISGYGHAEMVQTSAKTAPSLNTGAKKAFIKTLKATRVLNRDNRSNETTSTTTTTATTTTPLMTTISSATLKNLESDEKKSSLDQQPAELSPNPNLTNILPELVENPLRFALLNATNSV